MLSHGRRAGRRDIFPRSIDQKEKQTRSKEMTKCMPLLARMMMTKRRICLSNEEKMKGVV